MLHKYIPYIKSLFILMIVLSGIIMNAQNAWINEFHYDNVSTDAGEFIEVVVEFSESYAMSDFSVVLYNGNGGAVYDTKTLDVFSAGATSGNYTLYTYSYPVDGIQNGSPDGIALVYNGTLISGQFLSYEGAFTGVGGVAGGILSTDIGVSESGTTPVGYSLQLSGSGSHYSDFTWQPPAGDTPGALNNGQTFVSGGIQNPTDFTAVPFSSTRIDLSWVLNSNNDDVLLAWSTDGTFGTPIGTYSVGQAISGGGTVLYAGPATTTAHTSLNEDSEYFYRIWSVTSSGSYSTGSTINAMTLGPEPSSHPTAFAGMGKGPSQLVVSWTDSGADNYLVKGSAVGYGDIAVPVDSVPEANSLLVRNVPSGIGGHVFTGLDFNTTYYFEVFPYNGPDLVANYKVDGSVPQSSETTDDLQLNLLITEVADPADSSAAKFIEIMNAGPGSIDFTTTPVYLAREANGSGSWADVALTGSLAAGQKYVLAYVQSAADSLRFDNAYGLPADYYGLAISGNGDDTYCLYYGGTHASGTLLDIYGVIGQDGTGKAWEYTDGHAVRKRGVAVPNTSWDASEWVIIRSCNADNMTPFSHAEDVSWQGTTSTDWNTRGGNWSGTHGFVPDASFNVTIPSAANAPVVNEPAACNTLNMAGSAGLAIGASGKLTIIGIIP